MANEGIALLQAVADQLKDSITCLRQSHHDKTVDAPEGYNDEAVITARLAGQPRRADTIYNDDRERRRQLYPATFRSLTTGDMRRGFADEVGYAYNPTVEPFASLLTKVERYIRLAQGDRV